MKFWILGGALFIMGQFVYYFWSTPEKTPRPISPSPFDKMAANTLYGFSYCLSLLRLPFAAVPYLIKAFSVLVLKAHYEVSYYHLVFEALRILGDVVNWVLGATYLNQLSAYYPGIKYALYASIVAEAVRLFAEKGQMVVSALWQFLPHRRFANYLNRKLAQGNFQAPFRKRIFRYCQYYVLNNENRIQYILGTLRSYAATDDEAMAKLAYLSTLRIVAPPRGIRGGHVRDVARGEVFIHRQWLSDPWLTIGQALRRTPWLFDPRFLHRPFRYRSESNRMATLFVLSHARYCPTYALYQIGHEIKVARYDFFYRLLRWMGFDVEPIVQSDGTFPFDPVLHWLEARLCGVQRPRLAPLWTDQDVILDVGYRTKRGENLSTLDIAVQYTYPLKYVQEVLIAKITSSNSNICNA